MSSPTKLDAIVTHNSTLRQLFRQAETQRQLDDKIKSLIDSPAADHIRSALLRGRDLILVTDSPAWAAKLRYLVADIRTRVAAEPSLGDIESVRVKVERSSGARQPRSPQPATPMGANAAQNVEREAASIRDPKLRAALQRLSERRRE